ncbi:hypothetical protein GCM10011575_47290 [Microlunatus endophyticus]|uniref:TrbL/VirB6 plasmid conjugal transfer protein n=1 Tax=Microlunatus endophyticus TaxID=1716077 RepID=A0A917SKP1_9ACTN|nr:hypothetical protein [Microlunatus endophyticus]GGL83491.1 hypothetical protein GCM10011575_47290 [Microlunatus endophyticus]
MCKPWQPSCELGNTISGALADQLQHLADAVNEAEGRLIGAIGSLWVSIPTPGLSNSSDRPVTDLGHAPNAGHLTTLLGYAQWIGLVLAILSLVILGAIIASRMRAGEAMGQVGKIGWVLGGVILIAGGGSLASRLLSHRPTHVDSTAAFLQGSLWYITITVATASVIFAGIRMAWTMRAEPGQELLPSLITMLVVIGCGVSIINLLVTASDSFAVWILNASMDCHVQDSACFGQNIVAILALSKLRGGAVLVVIFVGVIAFFVGLMQIVLLVARSGMLVLMAGILPTAGAATNTAMGKNWFGKLTAWTVALMLYKPAAAVVYAAAFRLVGASGFAAGDKTGIVRVLSGLCLMALAAFALPALMKFVTPMVSAVGAGAGGAAAGALAGAAASGAIEVASRIGRSSTAGADQGADTGSGGPPGRNGPDSEGPSDGGPGEGPAGSDAGAGGHPGADVDSGSAEGGSGVGIPGSGSATVADAGGAAESAGDATAGSASEGAAAASSGSASAGSTAAGSTAAGGSTAAAAAAAGPAAIAIEGAKAAKKVYDAVDDTAKGVAADTTGEGDGPGDN